MCEAGGWRGKAGVGIRCSTPNTDLETKYGVAKKPLTSPGRAAWRSHCPSLQVWRSVYRTEMTYSIYQQSALLPHT